MLRIKVFPRIHITLIGLNTDGYRLNGGIGFSISSPSQCLLFSPSTSIEINDNRVVGFTNEELKHLKARLNWVMINKHLECGLKCTIVNNSVHSHVGYGSNSMIYLACVEALLIINTQVYSSKELVTLSNRGGASGVGINTYFSGGFIFDTGVLNDGHRTLAPSSAVNEEHQAPLVLKRLELPSWNLGLCIPSIARKSEEEERTFFKLNCPIEKDDVDVVLYETVYGITSSLMENDFEVFCKSIDHIQQTAWKSLERSQYGEELFRTDTLIRNAGAKCVGMSSMGPMLYFFGDDIDGIIGRVKDALPNCECIKTSFNNRGRIVDND